MQVFYNYVYVINLRSWKTNISSKSLFCLLFTEIASLFKDSFYSESMNRFKLSIKYFYYPDLIVVIGFKVVGSRSKLGLLLTYLNLNFVKIAK